ncbi:MAG: hypothetical protein ACLFUS_11810, partial [Candidatus Sumerlaeia bacterium]
KKLPHIYVVHPSLISPFFSGVLQKPRRLVVSDVSRVAVFARKYRRFYPQIAQMHTDGTWINTAPTQHPVPRSLRIFLNQAIHIHDHKVRKNWKGRPHRSIKIVRTTIYITLITHSDNSKPWGMPQCILRQGQRGMIQTGLNGSYLVGILSTDYTDAKGPKARSIIGAFSKFFGYSFWMVG